MGTFWTEPKKDWDLMAACWHVKIIFGFLVSNGSSNSKSVFDVAFGQAVWPNAMFQGHSGFCGEAMLCTSTSSLCPMWESLRGPWHAVWETPQWSRNRAEFHWLTTVTHWNTWVFLILTAWWNQIIITGSITDTVVNLACMISKNSNPNTFFIFSSTHQLMNEANRDINHTSMG